jgi:hypothetical protein
MADQPEPQSDIRFRQLCEQAAEEHDSARLIELVQQINQILDERAAKKALRSSASNSQS